jgi:hypothetical protein
MPRPRDTDQTVSDRKARTELEQALAGSEVTNRTRPDGLTRKGLSRQEAAQRLAREGPNEVPEKKTKSGTASIPGAHAAICEQGSQDVLGSRAIERGPFGNQTLALSCFNVMGMHVMGRVCAQSL